MATVRRFAVALALLVSILAGFAVAASPAAAAEPTPITDYANYPEGLGLFADGCSARGVNLLEGVTFTVDGTSSPTLRDFDLAPGDTIAMAWTGVAAGCEDTAISLSVKRANQPDFDPTDNQELVEYDICGGGGAACDGALTLTLPDDLCNWQVDAALGPPLSVVGPNGSYYNANTRVANGKPGGSDMLISANNGGTDCTPPPGAPDVDAEIDCARDGVVVTLTNPNADPITVEVNGVSRELPPGETDVVVPVAEDETVTVTVTFDGETIFDNDFTRDCDHPGAEPKAEVTPACSTGGFDVVLSNTGQGSAPFKLVVDGQTLFDGTINGGDSETVHVDGAEDSAHQVTATSGSTSLYDATFTIDCQTPADPPPPDDPPADPPAPVEPRVSSTANNRVLGQQVTREGQTTIPATGSNTAPLAETALALIGLGSALVFADRRRRRAH